MRCAALIIAFMVRAACAQTIHYDTPTVKSAVLGTTECIFWLTGANPLQSQWAVYMSGVLGPHPSIPRPANGTAIMPCPAPLDNFQISLDAAGNVTASIKPPPPITSALPDAVAPSGAIDGFNQVFLLPTIPARATSLLLWLNGQLLKAGGDYTLAGRTITMLRPPSAGGSLQALYV